MIESHENSSESIISIIDKFNIINDSLTLFKMQISTLQQQLRGVEKNVIKEFKTIKKGHKKENKTKNKRAPSGFAKPTHVTKELCEFMERPEGTEIARTEVTKTLVNYIKLNNLVEQITDSKYKKIVPDEKLKILLGLNNDDEIGDLNYFNIQKYMNKHFYSSKIHNTEQLEQLEQL